MKLRKPWPAETVERITDVLVDQLYEIDGAEWHPLLFREQMEVVAAAILAALDGEMP